MRTTRRVIAVSAALLSLAATSAHATRTITTSTPCSGTGGTAKATFKAGQTTTWTGWSTGQQGSTNTDSEHVQYAVVGGETYTFTVTDANYTTVSISMSDPTDTITAVGNGSCSASSTDLVGDLPSEFERNVGGPASVPVLLPDTTSIFD